MNESLHGPLGEPPDESLHDALHAAVARSAAEHEATGYRVPEAAVRTKARRRRTLRAAGVSTLSLALLAGAGVAVAQLGNDPDAGQLAGPHATANATDPAPERTHPACGSTEIGTTWVDSWITLNAEGWPLDVEVGQPPEVTTVLRNTGNQADDLLVVDVAEGPVLLAVDEARLVVGYARLNPAPGPMEVPAGDSVTFSGYGPLYRCPGVGDVASYPYLAPGRYDVYVGQTFSSLHATPTLWDRAGELTVTTPPDGSTSASPTPPSRPRAGECRSSLDSLTQHAGDTLAFDEPQQVLVVQGEPFDPHATVRNGGARDAEDAVQGGPVVLVLDGDGLVVARAELVDAAPDDGLPDGALAVGESLTFGQFEPLVDCVTGEPLAPGVYDYHFARLLTDPERRAAVDLLSFWRRLAVTDEAGASRQEVELPVLPACGESIDGLAFDPTFPTGTVTFAGRASWSVEDEEHVEDPDGGPAVMYEFTYTGPARNLTFLDENVVLVRDGVVVAHEFTGGWGGAQPETWTDGDTRTAAFTIFHDCAGEQGTDFEPSGPYTLAGYTVHDYEDEWGLTNVVVATLGPTEVDFGER